jgi:hypothetical protein
MSGARSEGGTVIEEHRTEVVTVPSPPPPPPGWVPPAPAPALEVTEIKTVERGPSPARSHHNPIIIDARGPSHTDYVETKRTTIVEQSDPMPVGPLALALPAERSSRSTASIQQEIRALEAEKEALRAERRADREMRKADRIRRGARASEGELVLYEQDIYEAPRQDVTIVKREYIEPDGGVKIVKDRKGRMAISVPKYLK